MAARRFSVNAGRTSKQGVQINIGKDYDEYLAMTTTLFMNPQDMKELNISPGNTVRLKSEFGGEALFKCQEGKIPTGMIFVPYGPPTCKLMGSETDGTGMPMSKGWECEVENLGDTPIR